MQKCDKRRIVELNKKEIRVGPIFYLMSRDQRVNDNWALLFSQELAEEKKEQLIVVFFITPHLLKTTTRHHKFMLEGLKDIEENLKKINICFFIEGGGDAHYVADFFNRKKAGAVITDFDPLKQACTWRENIAKKTQCKVFEVDAHNIVPYTVASSKQEFAAYTIRPKINKYLNDFLVPFPKIKKQEYKNNIKISFNDWGKLHKLLPIKKNIPTVKWIKSGEREAHKTLQKFLKDNLDKYDKYRNDPNENVLSNLSPYIHFGQISAQRIALSINKSKNNNTKESFLEEIIIRKELADNFCFYNKNYDNLNGFPSWAKESLSKHKKDKRTYVYSKKKFENAETHDDLWNASQLEMIKTGKMHSYLRMYWAKKILEWTSSPEEAIKIAIYLNDKYELDGRDAKGYTGIAWSIGGVHDRAWGERPIFGKIRYMSYNGSRSKFNIKSYITKIKNLP